MSDQWQQLDLVLNLDRTYAMDCVVCSFQSWNMSTCQIAWPNGFVTIPVKIDGPVSDEKLDY